MSKIIIISKCKFPSGDATSSYYTNIGFELNKNNPVFYVGLGYENSKNDFGSVVSLRKRLNNNLASKILDNLQFSKKALKYIKKQCHDGDAIIIDGVFSGIFYKKIHKIAKEHHFFVSISITEHFGNNQFLPLTIGHLIDFKNNRFLYSKLNNRSFGIIGISTHIVDYFKNTGFQTFLLPFTYSMDKNKSIDITKTEHDNINYFYAGNPGKKDLLFEMLSGFALLDSNSISKIKIHIVGPDYNWIKKNKGWKTVCDKLGDSLILYGKKDLSYIYSLYKAMDFTILLRNPNAYSSKGGFPTKICESLFFQTTPICNISSDLDKYLSKKNSIIVGGYDKYSFADAIRYSLTLTRNQICSMNTSSRQTVEKLLSSSNYSSTLCRFISNYRSIK